MRMKLLLYYSTLLSLFITIGTAILSFRSGQILFFLIFFPVVLYFTLTIFKVKRGRKLLLYYNFILITIMAVMGFVGTSSIPQLVSALLFLPMALYFWVLILPKKNKKLPIPDKMLAIQAIPSKEGKITKGNIKKIDEEQAPSGKFGKGFDLDRRMFLKLISSTGLMVFIFSIFSQKAEGAFFGSVPGPGTVALKDASGVVINPAQLQPTDGYKIARVDDSSPAYYGFIRKDGAWFIMREESDGTYKYAKGSSGFSANGWSVRNTSLTYSDFDITFG